MRYTPRTRPTLRLASAALALLLVAACTPQYSDNWTGLRPGMSKAEVVALLGEPRSRFVTSADTSTLAVERDTAVMASGEAETGYAERWVYGEHALGISSGLERALKYTSSNAYHVYFDSRGRVIDFQEPLPELDPDERIRTEYE